MSDRTQNPQQSEPTPPELDQLRMRVEAQDRLIEAIVSENAEIHQLRQRNHQLEQYVGKLLTLPGVAAALRVRRKVLRRPAGSQ